MLRKILKKLAIGLLGVLAFGNIALAQLGGGGISQQLPLYPCSNVALCPTIATLELGSASVPFANLYTAAASIGSVTLSGATAGPLIITESAAPSALLGSGKLYVKSSDHLLYFMSGGGVEYGLAGASAPVDAQYVTLALNATLTNERVLAGTANQILLADSGANGAITLSTPQDISPASNVQFGSIKSNTYNSTDAVASTLTLQNQVFTAGGTHSAVTISPTWTSENQIHNGLNVSATQLGADTQTFNASQFTLTKATALTTLATGNVITVGGAVTGTITAYNGVNVLAPTGGTITTATGINIANQSLVGGTLSSGITIASQTASSTVTRAMILSGTGANNAISFGGTVLEYSTGVAGGLSFYESTGTRGISLSLVAAGNQTIAATGGTLTLTSPNITSATATSITFPGGTALSAYTTWATFTPTVTLVGGAGNTVPQYVVNSGRYLQIGNIVFVDIYLTGDGGNEGAGTGIFNILLPVTAGASHPPDEWPCGQFTNNIIIGNPLTCIISGGATTVSLVNTGVTGMTGNDQNNANRDVRLKFEYEI